MSLMAGPNPIWNVKGGQSIVMHWEEESRGPRA